MKKEFEIDGYIITYNYSNDLEPIDFEIYKKYVVDKFVLSGIYSPSSDYLSFYNERHIMGLEQTTFTIDLFVELVNVLKATYKKFKEIHILKSCYMCGTELEKSAEICEICKTKLNG